MKLNRPFLFYKPKRGNLVAALRILIRLTDSDANTMDQDLICLESYKHSITSINECCNNELMSERNSDLNIGLVFVE